MKITSAFIKYETQTLKFTHFFSKGTFNKTKYTMNQKYYLQL